MLPSLSFSVVPTCRNTAAGLNTTKQAPRFSKAEKQKVLDCGILFNDTSHSWNLRKGYVYGIELALRGEDEHHSLKITQFTLNRDEDDYERLTYDPSMGSMKNNHGGYADKHEVMPVHMYANHDDPRLCPIAIFKEELTKRPIGASENFYLAQHSTGSKANFNFKYTSRFKTNALGVNEIKKFAHTMCAAAGIPDRTNHAFRRTAVSDMFQANIPVCFLFLFVFCFGFFFAGIFHIHCFFCFFRRTSS